MKKISFLLFFVLLCFYIKAQEVNWLTNTPPKDNTDIYHIFTMNDSTKYYGVIIDTLGNGKIKIRIDNGRRKRLIPSKIKNITLKREDVDLNSYGGSSSIGISILGGGIIGIPLRLYPDQLFVIELGAFLRPVIERDNRQNFNYSGEALFTGGFNFFFKKKIDIERRAVSLDGMFIKGGATVGRYKEVMIAIGYVNELFRKPRHHRSAVFEFGGVVSKLLNGRYAAMSIGQERNISVGFYIRYNWSWYL